MSLLPYYFVHHAVINDLIPFPLGPLSPAPEHQPD